MIILVPKGVGTEVGVHTCLHHRSNRRHHYYIRVVATKIFSDRYQRRCKFIVNYSSYHGMVVIIKTNCSNNRSYAKVCE